MDAGPESFSEDSAADFEPGAETAPETDGEALGAEEAGVVGEADASFPPLGAPCAAVEASTCSDSVPCAAAACCEGAAASRALRSAEAESVASFSAAAPPTRAEEAEAEIRPGTADGIVDTGTAGTGADAGDAGSAALVAGAADAAGAAAWPSIVYLTLRTPKTELTSG